MKITRSKIKKIINHEQKLINGELFFESAVIVPLIKANKEFHLLFQVRSDNIRQGGEIGFPGGQVEPKDRNLTETAVRETCEELGIKPSDVNTFGYLGSYLNPMGALVHAIIGELKVPPEKFSVNKSEVKEIFTVPLSFFENTEPEYYHMKISVSPYIKEETGEVSFPVEKLGLHVKYSKRREGITYPVIVYKINDKIIWGITAYIVKYFVDRLKKIN